MSHAHAAVPTKHATTGLFVRMLGDFSLSSHVQKSQHSVLGAYCNHWAKKHAYQGQMKSMMQHGITGLERVNKSHALNSSKPILFAKDSSFFKFCEGVVCVSYLCSLLIWTNLKFDIYLVLLYCLNINVQHSILLFYGPR